MEGTDGRYICVGVHCSSENFFRSRSPRRPRRSASFFRPSVRFVRPFVTCAWCGAVLRSWSSLAAVCFAANLWLAPRPRPSMPFQAAAPPEGVSFWFGRREGVSAPLTKAQGNSVDVTWDEIIQMNPIHRSVVCPIEIERINGRACGPI